MGRRGLVVVVVVLLLMGREVGMVERVEGLGEEVRAIPVTSQRCRCP